MTTISTTCPITSKKVTLQAACSVAHFNQILKATESVFDAVHIAEARFTKALHLRRVRSINQSNRAALLFAI